ncbi:MAG TPA: nucleoside hydrolase [Candidatus Saccharimonadales bacterium]|nr:nucleoside hydrolase [Candidatus Saccharimonadales bacterium]
MKKSLLIAACFMAGALAAHAAPVNVIFDTDIGNDVDDVLALSMLHALQERGDCRLLGVTVTIPDDLAGPFVDAMNTFYGHLDIPIGSVRPSPTQQPSKFLQLANAEDGGKPRYPHKLKHGSDAPESVPLLRKLLRREADHSVVLVQVGYFSNFAALLDAPEDAELVKQKVKYLSVMAGSFKPMPNHFLEFNVVKDLPASLKLVKSWPTPIVWSGFEIGLALPYPAQSIERDYRYVRHHPAAEAYYLYNPPPHERPTWDLTATLYAVLPDRGYFDLSPDGNVTMDPDGMTHFTPQAGGRDRYLILTEKQIPRVKEALVLLSSQPPK